MRVIAGRGDDILADILAVRRTRQSTADSVGDGILGIAVLQTSHRRGEGRIRRAEVLGLGIGLHRNRHRLDGKLRRIVGHRVVALRGGAGRGDDILTNILASRTADGVSNDAFLFVILQSGHRRGEGRISFTIVLLLGFGLDGNVGAGDGQITGHVGHRVVALRGLAGRRNRVRADILAGCRTRLCTADGHHKRTSAHKGLLRVTVLQAIGNRPSQIGIALAIDLRLIIRRHRQRSLRHIDSHNLLLLAAVRGLGAVSREGHRVVARRCRSAGEGIGGGAVFDTGRKVRMRQRSVFAVREHHVGYRLAVNDGLRKVLLVIHREQNLGVDLDGEFHRIARAADVTIRVGRGHHEGHCLDGRGRVFQRNCINVICTAGFETRHICSVVATPAIGHRTVGNRRAELDSIDGTVAAHNLGSGSVHHHCRVHRHGDSEDRTLTDGTRGRGDGIDGVLDTQSTVAQRATDAIRCRRSGRCLSTRNALFHFRDRPLVGGGIALEVGSIGNSIKGGSTADVRSVGNVGELVRIRGKIGTI